MLHNLRFLRTRAGLSQQQLADVINVSQQSINKYENHDVEPNIETLCAIADYFNVSVDFLVGRTDVERKNEPTEFCQLNSAEKALIDKIRTLSPSDRELVSAVIRRL
ncbi:MAG: helix-turn-helix transcriptional regulator [Clostridia bacterium]|nr:helix-turn-helix transcriptional regulator [Clostridia bacterium]